MTSNSACDPIGLSGNFEFNMGLITFEIYLLSFSFNFNRMEVIL